MVCRQPNRHASPRVLTMKGTAGERRARAEDAPYARGFERMTREVVTSMKEGRHENRKRNLAGGIARADAVSLCGTAGIFG
jgi:hypothetical protein